MKKFYYTDGTNTFGPFTIQELSQKSLSKDTYIWYEGMDNWKKAGELHELDSLFAPRQITPPPIKPPGLRPPPITRQPAAMHQTYGYAQKPNAPKKSNKLLIGVLAIGLPVAILVALLLTGVLDTPASLNSPAIISRSPFTGNPEKDFLTLVDTSNEFVRVANNAASDGVLDSREIRNLAEIFKTMVEIIEMYVKNQELSDRMEEYLNNNTDYNFDMPNEAMDNAMLILSECDGYDEFVEIMEKIAKQSGIDDW